MALSKDWREFLELLNSRAVDYVIVGAQSLAFHGRPRYTGDLDILVRPTPDKARLLLALLNQSSSSGPDSRRQISSSPSKLFNSDELRAGSIC